jgi:hydroxymethylpyrimidine kinase/phosphomethylpyrimidine kinase
VYGTSAITALTAQNTLGVSAVHVVPAEFVTAQIEAVVSDIGCDAVKTGMLATSSIVGRLAPLVVDPVLAAESGAGLIEGSAADVLMKKLVPLATVVTPNAVEAGRLLGMTVENLEDQRAAARRLGDAGARAVLVKGGHLPGDDAVDVLWAAGELRELAAPRLAANNTHGTGCILASAIAFHLGGGAELAVAVERAKAFVTRAIAGGLAIGKGAGPANPFAGRG